MEYVVPALLMLVAMYFSLLPGMVFTVVCATICGIASIIPLARKLPRGDKVIYLSIISMLIICVWWIYPLSLSMVIWRYNN